MHAVSPWTYLKSWVESRNKSSIFNEVTTYVLFVGHPRTGSSVTGSLLNAHRNALVCNELNVLRYVRHGYTSRPQLLWLHCMRDAYFEQLGRTWTGYDYRVQGGHQGKVEQLHVIGDKKAARTAEALRKNSKPLHQLQEIVQAPVRLVHVMRHPLDVIGRVCLRENMSPAVSAKRFFDRCDTVQRIIEENEFPMHTVYLEQMISQPETNLRKLAAFCRLSADEDYIQQCAETLMDKPRQCRGDVPWGEGDSQRIMQQAKDYDYLQPYTATPQRRAA